MLKLEGSNRQGSPPPYRFIARAHTHTHKKHTLRHEGSISIPPEAEPLTAQQEYIGSIIVLQTTYLLRRTCALPYLNKVILPVRGDVGPAPPSRCRTHHHAKDQKYAIQ